MQQQQATGDMPEDGQSDTGNVGSDLRVAEIHALASAALISKDADFKAWPPLRELRAMTRPADGMTYLEALVMLQVIERLWPSRTCRSLFDLRKIRRKKNQLDRFEVFYQQIQDHLAPLQLTNHGYSEGVFSNLDHDVIWAAVAERMSLLNQMGYEVFLNSGTLLGVVRDKKLIDHDDDVDFGLILKATNSTQAAREWGDLRAALIAAGLLDRKTKQDHEVMKLTPVSGVEIDLFPAWIEEDRVFVFPHTYGDLHRDDLLPLKTCAVSGQAIPAEPEKMLAVNYGHKWRIRNAVFKFDWTGARRKFTDYLGKGA